jgi:hypothetical protein
MSDIPIEQLIEDTREKIVDPEEEISSYVSDNEEYPSFLYVLDTVYYSYRSR